jgi:transcriptional regulator GlxA family with amidase domain
VLQLRMQSAESLMAAGARSLPDVAAAVGFGNPAALVVNGAADLAERGLQSA